jgi:molybdate transport system ATP-binding protein
MLSVRVSRRVGTFLLDVALTSEHQRVVLFGPSGAGKTLTLQCVAGFLSPERGRIQIGDTTLYDSSASINIPPWHRRVGLMVQTYTLLPHLTIGGNVAYGLRPIWRGKERMRVEMLLAVVGLEGYADRMPHELSGGQRQRVALAQVLASDPRLLALDEPFSSVDAPVRERLRRDLLSLIEAFRVPLIFVTHDFGEAYLLGQTIAIITAGRIIQTGTPAEIAAHPRTAAVARLVGASNILAGEVVGADNGRMTVRSNDLLVRAAGSTRRIGDRVLYCVRPENLRLTMPAPGAPAATVTGILLRSGSATVLLAAGDLALESVVTGPAPSLGQTVGIAVAEGAAHVLDEEDR